MSELRASMAGSVWKIVVEEGQQIAEGQEAIILESMKMEIPITAEKNGTVSKITVKENDFVNEGDVLVVID